MKIIFLLILLFIISCNNRATKLHYYDGNINNGKYILASDLKSFFLNNDIKKIPIKNKRVNKEISEIKQKIILKNQIIIPDDSYYVFAFVTEKDTLYADSRLEFWRYKDKGISYKLNDSLKNIILKNYKLNPNQQ
jgi:hypothetical protein